MASMATFFLNIAEEIVLKDNGHDVTTEVVNHVVAKLFEAGIENQMIWFSLLWSNRGAGDSLSVS